MTGKTVTIIRGVSGSGKSTFATFLKMMACNETRICCADDYFINADTGVYEFDVTKLGAAHGACRFKFSNLITDGVPHIIVNNTSTKVKEFKDYAKEAADNGYRVHVICMENFHGGENVHGVPVEVLENQAKNLKNSFKPI